jgi:hypothetical protein
MMAMLGATALTLSPARASAATLLADAGAAIAPEMAIVTTKPRKAALGLFIKFSNL